MFAENSVFPYHREDVFTSYQLKIKITKTCYLSRGAQTSAYNLIQEVNYHEHSKQRQLHHTIKDWMSGCCHRTGSR